MAESQNQETPMIVVENEEAGTQKETNVIITSSNIDDNTKGILKKRGRIITPEERAKRMSSGVQWDEMNIIMTEHPPDKDYGHMKIEEPKTPYHEMVEEESKGMEEKVMQVDELAERVQLAVDMPQHTSNWDRESESSGDEQLTDEAKQKKKEFKKWRTAHYNEFQAVQRAREPMKEDEEELRRLEEKEKQQRQQQQEGGGGLG